MGQVPLSKTTKVDVVVLMAGEGRRMRPYTADRPKSLLRCDDGISIFGHILKAFSNQKLDIDAIPVIGHGANKVHDEVQKMGIKDNCVYNPFYNTAGPIISLWLGLLQSRNENLVIVNGDTLLKPSLTKEVVSWFNQTSISDSLEAALCTSYTSNFENDDMKVILDQDGKFTEVGKHIRPENGCFKSAGVLCVKGHKSKLSLKQKLEKLLMNSRTLQKNYHWHNILNEIKSDFKIDLLQVDIKSWDEMDTPAELEIINAQSL
ncbi:NTP transferase domain-containing protein [Proteinivorax hydrogeniformans]|uniref:NTP transferase domain-containing protein n=1 Tax=Proteinivorax hydrogeniformans TaxID=1826727 RepID=A0AAU8HX31_9FIRM